MSNSPKRTDLPGLGARLREAREAAGLSQAQVAKLLKMHRPTITEMEQETRKVTAGELIQLAQLYKVSVEWLTGREGNTDGIKMAARKLSGLKQKDREMVMRIIDSLSRDARNS